MRLLRSELLKLVTTRLLLWLGLLVVALEVLVISLHVSQDSLSSLAEPGSQRDVISIAGVAALIALLVGVVASAGEYGHGTISHTFLVAPVRERVVLAKLLACGIAGAAVAVLAGVVAWALAALLLSARSVPLQLGSAGVVRPLFGTVAAAAVTGAIGVGFGCLVRRQTAAVVVVFVWLLVAEPLLAIAHVDRYAPGHAIASVVEAGAQGSSLLAFLPGLLLALAYAGAFALAGAVVVSRTDVS
ncbi:MAG TPA: ABC transporter permease subunit [Gaiellaceae bacterium]|nr:ABC transporter permease subunit [Gaiellaceae bacterium]